MEKQSVDVAPGKAEAMQEIRDWKLIVRGGSEEGSETSSEES